MKRVLDISGALILLLLTGWVILVCLIAASVSTGQWGLYRQTRIGKNQQPFDMYKLRTMRNIKGYDSSTTLKDDPRVTRLGRFLRMTKLDELPQLFNILNGTMSFVGPRPTVSEDVERMTEAQKRRFAVQPGLSGLAQINGNTALSWHRRIEFDLQYIDRQSTWLDMKIILQTIQLLITGRADSHPASADEWAEEQEQ